MESSSNESQMLLALQSIRKDPEVSLRAAARIYGVCRMKLARRQKGMLSRRDTTPKSRNLTNLEESSIVQYIIDLDSRSFPPRLVQVEDMANRLLADRDAPRVGKHWASNFVKRQLDLRTRRFRRLDYQRAKCEDPATIQAWFDLVRNTIAKYGIVESDIYNFDETGFLMGVIGSGMVVTMAERRTNTKMVQPGSRQWVTVIQGVNSSG